MSRLSLAIVAGLLLVLTAALPYDPDEVGYNLNQNQTATDPLQYWGEWPNHDFHASPSNWRMPMYTLFIDRFVNGDPTNDNANGTQFEHDILSNQLRYGGDVQGLQDTLDYVQGMGVKTIYIAGSPMINMPWASDQYSPLDLTLLDRHLGDIQAWRDVIADIHGRGMYVIFDNTFATLGDLMGFEGYLNASTPFAAQEHNVVWKSDRRYHDFQQSDTELSQCTYPRFWGDDGHPVTNNSFLVGCRDSDFDAYGEVASFGDYPEWQRQLSKFAFVQDRLREWRPSVLAKIQHFSCMTIAMLDIDGFRIDKAVQVTVDAQGQWSNAIRQCAKKYNKNNFYIPGEIVTGNSFGAIYVGRGMEPEMQADNLTEVVTTTKNTSRTYIRGLENSALDGAAFHYTVYRALTRFLGMDGTYAAEGDPPVNFVETWNALLKTNDMTNAYTGEFDPRHMFGISNQDVFRWPSIRNGTEKNLLGLYIITLLFPGIPTLSWGEEQAVYVLESTNSNYVFGRAPMSSSRAWQLHGCYTAGSIKYANFPLDAGLYGCEDDNISLDHRDPSHPVRNIIKRMFEMRDNYPSLNDGYYLQQLSNTTHDVYLPGSNHTPTETGLWSVYRSTFSGVQDFTGIGAGQQSVWLVYTNEDKPVTYNYDCSAANSLIAPFPEGVTVKNLFPPYEEYTLERGAVTLGLEGATDPNGCISNLQMAPWAFKAFVPKDSFIPARPVITEFAPGHDFRVLSTIKTGEAVHVTFGFSDVMSCDSILYTLQVNSTVDSGDGAFFVNDTVKCTTLSPSAARWVGEATTVFTWEADLANLHHGVHRITAQNVPSVSGNTTNSVDHFMIRIGDFSNPMIFPATANYSGTALSKDADGTLAVSHNAAGADLWRYSLNFGTNFSDWTPYTGGASKLAPRQWSGTKTQAWEGEHVILQYWGRLAGSSDHYQHADLDWKSPSPRRLPHLFLEGEFNKYGFDSGLDNQMQLSSDGVWEKNFMAEWPAQVQLNAWGINPDGLPDVTQVYGDLDGDGVLDRIPPQSLLLNMVNLTKAPPSPHLNYLLQVNDGSMSYELKPAGSRWIQLAIFLLLALIPIATAVGAVFIFIRSFYQIKFNKYGASQATSVSTSLFPFFNRQKDVESTVDGLATMDGEKRKTMAVTVPFTNATFTFSVGNELAATPNRSKRASKRLSGMSASGLAQANDGPDAPERRVVLIATMEYEIEDWGVKIKIGGLGVMASLMGKNLGHQDLIWVVPCVGGVEYPQNPHEAAEPMKVHILDETYEIQVRIHIVRNITYVLLDAPIFRQQTKAEPYPARMDDLTSAVYYSAWNACIAEAIRRFEPDLYHINDYHGAIAPLHLLPATVPCALSLHNAEFQGLWPITSREQRDEVCRVFDLDPVIVQEYVQFGEVFNLLHAAASYLRIHQRGFGAVGVSRKYGKRSYARYPIFWGLKEIGALPNPDPSDTAEWTREEVKHSTFVRVDRKFEAARAGLRIEAQKWAGLDEDPTAELFVFVGRWSMQKGLDLIADIFPSILENHPKSQLICVGPVIDLYGKFAAIKLARLMKLYPRRVYSKPEFTALPPYIFSGAEFALIPSRDEPFGLVAVEFGRKGALGVGARVGGLGQMPGWWYPVESTSTKHLLQQFKGAIESALATPFNVRAELRARSAKQRFPVAEWVATLETLQSTAMKRHHETKHRTNDRARSSSRGRSGATTPRKTRSRVVSEVGSRARTSQISRRSSPIAAHDIEALQRSLEQLRNANKPGRLTMPPSPAIENTGPLTGDSEQPESRRSSDEWDGYFAQANPALKTFVDQKRIDYLYDDTFDDYYDQQNSALKSFDVALPDASLQAEFQKSLFHSDEGLTALPEPVAIQPYRHLGLQDARNSQMSADSQATALTRFPELYPQMSPYSSRPHSLERDSVASQEWRYSEEPSQSVPVSSPPTVSREWRYSVEPTRSASVSSPPTVSRDWNYADSPVQSLTIPSKPAASREWKYADTPSQSLTISSKPTQPGSSVGQATDSDQAASSSAKTLTTSVVTPPAAAYARFAPGATLSLDAVVGTKRDLQLQKTDPFFTDTKSDYQRVFEHKLLELNAKNSYDTCINDFIEKSEKDWYNRLRGLKMGNMGMAHKIGIGKWAQVSTNPVDVGGIDALGGVFDDETAEQFAIEEDYEPPTGLTKLLVRRVGDWPIYSILLAMGQILAANSYQITLLTGEVGEAATKLYTIASIYLATSIMWWVIYRRLKAVWVLSLPFAFYGLAFFMIGMASVIPSYDGRKWSQNIASGLYAVASSSGSLFFALNFGDQSGAPITTWVFRACIVQGTQQIYIAGLWWWGSNLTKVAASGAGTTSFIISKPIAAIAICVTAAIAMWVIGFILHRGLPKYYRQTPGAVPDFVRSVFRRKIVLWFFFAVIVQNFFLSGPYGRNWLYLWSSRAVGPGYIAALAVFFLLLVWVLILVVFHILSKSHPWILPIFAIGLGAPRWCQMLWGTSGIGLYLPWMGSPIASAIVGRALWLWLGVLDSFQGVGFGMILLQTLTRFHITFTLVAAQVLGSVATMVARACAPDNLGPGPVFPNFGLGAVAGLKNAWFWVALLAQLSLNVFAFKCFRKEQLTKP